jgi:hypothetical protein
MHVEGLKKAVKEQWRWLLCRAKFQRALLEYKSEALSPELLAWLIRSAPASDHEWVERFTPCAVMIGETETGFRITKKCWVALLSKPCSTLDGIRKGSGFMIRQYRHHHHHRQQWLYSPSLGIGRYSDFNPCTGDQPVARPLPTHNATQSEINSHRFPCLEWHSNQWSQHSNGRKKFKP